MSIKYFCKQSYFENEYLEKKTLPQYHNEEDIMAWIFCQETKNKIKY